MRIPSLFMGLMALVLASACGASSTPEAPKAAPAPAVQPKASYPAGSLVPRVQVAADTSQHYAVYLPQGYQQAGAFPALYLFDSHGRSNLPLKQYSSLADQYGWVLIASANSRNGQQPQQSLAIYDALRKDAREKFFLDSAQVFVGGFSGGARVAASIAQARPGIAGVIACGAGHRPTAQDKFAFIGLVGTEDFNYQEFKQLEATLATLQVDALVEYFIGGHEWPALPIMAKAFQYLQFRAMAQQHRPLDQAAVDAMVARYSQQDLEFAGKGQNRYRRELQQKTIAYLKGLADTQPMEALYAELESHPEVQAFLQSADQDLQREMAMRQEYGAKLQTEPLETWERIAGMLRKIGAAGGDNGWLHMRVINFLSLNTYMNATGALQASDLPAADRYIALYSMIDPSNSEHAVLRAEWLMRSGAPSDALASLDHAFQLGFRDWQRMMADPAFQSLQAEAGFTTLISRMQADPEPAH